MIEIKFNLSKLNGSKRINWVKSCEWNMNWVWIKEKPKELKRKYICNTNTKEVMCKQIEGEIFVKTFTNRI